MRTALEYSTTNPQTEPMEQSWQVGARLQVKSARLRSMDFPPPVAPIHPNVVHSGPFEFLPHRLLWVSTEFCPTDELLVGSLGYPCRVVTPAFCEFCRVVCRPPNPYQVIAATHPDACCSDFTSIDSNDLLDSETGVRILVA
jgi:hypothetical protein